MIKANKGRESGEEFLPNPYTIKWIKDNLYYKIEIISNGPIDKIIKLIHDYQNQQLTVRKKSKKVYCENCKHHNEYSSCRNSCSKVLKTTYKDTPTKIRKINIYAIPYEHNKDNACVYFKPKDL